MNRNITTLIVVTFMAINALVAYTSPIAVIAQTNNSTSATNCSTNSSAICNPLNASSITVLLTDLVNIAIPIGAVIAVIMYVYVGFKFIFAQGKPEKIKEAWDWFIWVSIGTAILIGAKVIVSIMESTLTSAGVVQSGLLPTQ
jgi:hypothetical protein